MPATVVGFSFDALVWTADGQMAGSVSGVVVSPDREAVSHLLVRYGAIVVVDRVVPLADVREVEDHSVALTLTAEELDEMPDLEERAYIPLAGLDSGSEASPALSAPGFGRRTPAIALPPLISEHTSDQANVEQVWRNVPEGSLVLREDTVVYAPDGRRVGSLEEVALDPVTGTLAGIIVNRGGRIKAIPPAWIERSDEKTGIVLAVDRHAVDSLPDYH